VVETVIILLVVGFVLLGLETLLPGLVAGVLGFVCLAASVIVAYTSVGANAASWTLVAVVGGSLVATIVYVRYFPTSRLARRFVSERVVGDLGVERKELLDRRGLALTPLRPCGTALLGEERVDVITEGGLIERGQSLKVVAVEGVKVVVRATD
jgi:membrane-bound serine protease (ClpP class)